MKTKHAYQKKFSVVSFAKTILFGCFFLVIVILSSCDKIDLPRLPNFKTTSATVATDWYRLQLRILLQRNSAFNGLYFEYIGTGLYEAVRHDIPFSVSFSTKLYHMPAMPAAEEGKKYNWQLSANAAMAAMVRSFYNGLTPENLASIDSLENAWNQKLKIGTSNDVFGRSQDYGRSIATAIHNWFLTDDLNPSNVGYVPPVCPGCWIPTPPGFVNPPVLPYIGKAHTFLASNYGTSVPSYPVAYSENSNSSYYKIAKQLYDISYSLTDEQKNTALYWNDQGDGVGYTPAGHDMLITTQIIEQHQACLGEAAEAYAKAGIAERDGAIVCFRAKYKYNMIRPVSYIQRVIDPKWMPFIITPPHPEYPAAHSSVTGSVMAALTGVFGGNTAFTDHSYDFRGWAPRNYDYIFAAAEDAGISRLYGGIHYLPSINEGLSIAKEVGGRVGEIKLHDIQF